MKRSRSRTISARRREWRLTHLQAALWSAGNALTSGAPIYFLAMLFGAKNTQVGLLIALPTLLGFVRLAAPWCVSFAGGDLKRACIVLFAVSYVVAIGLPAIAGAAPASIFGGPLLWLIVILCLHQTLEYLALVLLASWLGELVPARIRGGFFGARQFWHLSLEIPAILASGYFIAWWSAAYPSAKPVGYALTLGVGVGCLFASVAVLTRLRPPRSAPHRPLRRASLHEILAPFADPRFRRLLCYGCWLSTFNGLTASPQTSYPRDVLGLDLDKVNAMRTGMRLGQFALSRPLGRLCDRIGDRAVGIVSQLFVAAAPLCFLVSTPQRWYWIAGAYLLWAWYVGLNIGLLNWTLKFAPRGNSAPYAAAYFGVTGVCFAAASVSGGYLLDKLIERLGAGTITGGWTIYHFTFLFAWVTRTLGVGLLARVPPAEDRG